MTDIRGLRENAATAAVAVMHVDSKGSTPSSSAPPNPMHMPARMIGKKGPPFQPKFMQQAITKAFANPIAIRVAPLNMGQRAFRSVDYSEPRNSAKGNAMATTPNTRPHKSVLTSRLSPIFSVTFPIIPAMLCRPESASILPR